MSLPPLESLYERRIEGELDVPLPPALETIYGRLRFPPHPKGPWRIGNFVSTLDGVTALNVAGHPAGGDISGFNEHDRFVMGLLRVVADTVIVGAGTLRSVPDHLWTAEYIYPDLADLYKEARRRLGKPEPPWNVIVTASGELDLGLPVFQSGLVPVLIVTTTQGANQIREHKLPPHVQIAAVQHAGRLSANAILDEVLRVHPMEVILIEGGPQLMGNFFAEKCLDELFLTFSPQVAGRDHSVERPGFVTGQMFAPEEPLWGTLAGVKRGGSHLFLRYAFESVHR